ncbi:MAG: hypothetical protein ACJAZS_000866 [Alteromonas naphthalenivorans]|jgi:hypothetical protein
MKKKLLFLCLNILIFSSLRADFFAFRKLTHAQTGKVVYFLYDIHASVEVNPISSENYSLHIKSLAEEQRREFMQKTNAHRSIIADSEEQALLTDQYEESELEPISSQYGSFFKSKHLPYLVKQHQELLSIVRHCGISLINEEWQDRFQEDTYISNAESEVLSLLGGRALAKENWLKKYFVRTPVTPMKGLGKKLVGKKYNKRELQNVDGAEDVYFYDVDKRKGRSIVRVLDDSAKVDADILIGLNKILHEKNKDSVIVAAGFTHCVEVVKTLMTQGYMIESLVVSRELRLGQKFSESIRNVLHQLEANEVPILGPKTHKIAYKLVSRPLHLKNIFKSEIPNCRVQRESIVKKVSDFVRNLFNN